MGDVGAARGPDPHFHRTMSEAFRNESGAPASMLLLLAPSAPRERYVEELAEIAWSGRDPSDEEWTEIYARHDQYMS
jgi:hypothetical protein